MDHIRNTNNLLSAFGVSSNDPTNSVGHAEFGVTHGLILHPHLWLSTSHLTAHYNVFGQLYHQYASTRASCLTSDRFETYESNQNVTESSSTRSTLGGGNPLGACQMSFAC